MLKSTVLVVLAVVIPVRVWMWAVNDLFTVNGTSCSRARVDAGNSALSAALNSTKSCSRARVDAGGKIELFGHYTTRGIGTFGSDKAW